MFGLDRVRRSCSLTAAQIGGTRYSVFFRKRFFAKVLPEPDLKYRSNARALVSSSTATYKRRVRASWLRVEVT